MYFVRWSSAKRIHKVASPRGEALVFDSVERKIKSQEGGLVFTTCGVPIPDEHEAIMDLSREEYNNELCEKCRSSGSL